MSGAPQSSGTVANAGAGTVGPGVDSTLCKAFRTAAENWCDDKGNRDGKFNDYFFRALEGTPPDGAALASSMAREMPFLANTVAGGARAVSSLPALAAQWAGDPFAQVFLGLMQQEAGLRAAAEAGQMTWDAFRFAMRNNILGAGLATTPRFPDAMLNGQAVEIKGPGDSFRPGQAEDYGKIDPNKPVMEISCQSCGADCAATNKC